ncbi:MAG: hypothetical protein IIU45_03245 [Lachnospiraceae bacterium]|nr:hypothetical protein [Lachnospiraceae bacterium]MBQ5375865.1 hypothetical protein [Lachnospiraceae bacterium]MBR1848160.1 hypothetical protein [Lachnospiraceae bacterium]
MITLFTILMFYVFGHVIWFALKASWGLLKFLLFIVFLPLILVGMVISGLVAFAIPILVIVGIFALIGCFAKN